jgi:hypothetical protein
MAPRHTETRQSSAVPRGQGERITSAAKIARRQLESSWNREYGEWLETSARETVLTHEVWQAAPDLCFDDSVTSQQRHPSSLGQAHLASLSAIRKGAPK